MVTEGGHTTHENTIADEQVVPGPGAMAVRIYDESGGSSH